MPFLLTILLVAALWMPGARAQTTDKPAATASPAAIVARPLAELAIYPERTAPAQSLAPNESKLSAEIAARIVALPYDAGQTVRRGDVVARLDPRDFELAVERARAGIAAAEARIALAEAQLKRAKTLAQQKFIAEEVVTQRETELAVQRADLALQQANLAAARRDLDKATVRAPFDAIVKQRHAGVGELATPGAALVTLVDRAQPEVSAQVQWTDSQSLRDANSAVFSAGVEYPVKLTRISPAVDRQSRTVEVRLAFRDRVAPPGTSGRLVWRETRPHVPPEYVVRREGTLGVFVIAGNMPEFVPLPDAQEGRPAPAALPPGTKIVTEGRHTLGARPQRK
jgi:RND family efflux transporter MFP subunit